MMRSKPWTIVYLAAMIYFSLCANGQTKPTQNASVLHKKEVFIKHHSKRKSIKKLYHVTVSAYIPTGKKTSLGNYPIPDKTIAVSQDLLHLMGKEVFVDGIGRVLVTDSMDDKWKRRIDVCVKRKTKARKIGIIKNVKLIVVSEDNTMIFANKNSYKILASI